jgi:hypothetical protein
MWHPSGAFVPRDSSCLSEIGGRRRRKAILRTVSQMTHKQPRPPRETKETRRSNYLSKSYFGSSPWPRASPCCNWRRCVAVQRESKDGLRDWSYIFGTGLTFLDCLWSLSDLVALFISFRNCAGRLLYLDSGASVREGVRGRPAPGCDVGEGNANGRSHCEVWGTACVTLTS